MNIAAKKINLEQLIDYIEEECYDQDVCIENSYLRECFQELINKLNEKNSYGINVLAMHEFINYCINNSTDEDQIDYNIFINNLDYFKKNCILLEEDIVKIKENVNEKIGNFQKKIEYKCIS